MDDEYELLSREQIEQLKKDAENYKNDSFTKKQSEDKLFSAIIDLTKTMNKVISIFEDVKIQLIKEQEQGEGPDAKLEELMQQNKYIAKALVLLDEKLGELQNNQPIKETTNDYLEKTKWENSQFTMPNEQQQKQDFLQNNNQQTQGLDYQTWNYTNPNKPGVSQSNIKNTQNYNQLFDPNQPTNNNLQNFQEQQENLFTKQKFPKQEYEETRQIIKSNEIPELKPINTPKESLGKRKKFGLFWGKNGPII